MLLSTFIKRFLFAFFAVLNYVLGAPVYSPEALAIVTYDRIAPNHFVRAPEPPSLAKPPTAPEVSDEMEAAYSLIYRDIGQQGRCKSWGPGLGGSALNLNQKSCKNQGLRLVYTNLRREYHRSLNLQERGKVDTSKITLASKQKKVKDTLFKIYDPKATKAPFKCSHCDTVLNGHTRGADRKLICPKSCPSKPQAKPAPHPPAPHPSPEPTGLHVVTSGGKVIHCPVPAHGAKSDVLCTPPSEPTGRLVLTAGGKSIHCPVPINGAKPIILCK